MGIKSKGMTKKEVSLIVEAIMRVASDDIKRAKATSDFWYKGFKGKK